MKEAILIILALLLWFFSSQWFGYSLTPTDHALITRIQQKIDTIHYNQPVALIDIEQRLSWHLRSLSPQERAFVVLDQVFFIIQRKNSISPSTSFHPSIISARASLF
jgi:hypothetical protein